MFSKIQWDVLPFHDPPWAGQEKLFSQNLRTLASKSLISNLTKVIKDQNDVKTYKLAWDAKQQAGTPKKEMEEERYPVSNALIAFTYKGLLAVSAYSRLSIPKR